MHTLIALVVLLGLLSLFSLCLTGFPIMKMDSMGQVSDCSLAHVTALCPVTAVQQLGFWQHVLVTTSLTALLLALMAATVLSGLKRGTTITQDVLVTVAYRIRQRLFEPTLLLNDCLKQALSHGILHPKIY